MTYQEVYKKLIPVLIDTNKHQTPPIDLSVDLLSSIRIKSMKPSNPKLISVVDPNEKIIWINPNLIPNPSMLKFIFFKSTYDIHSNHHLQNFEDETLLTKSDIYAFNVFVSSNKTDEMMHFTNQLQKKFNFQKPTPTPPSL